MFYTELEELESMMETLNDVFAKDLPILEKAEALRAEEGDSKALDIVYRSFGLESEKVTAVDKVLGAIVAMVVKIKNFIRNLYLKLFNRRDEIDKRIDKAEEALARIGKTFAVDYETSYDFNSSAEYLAKVYPKFIKVLVSKLPEINKQVSDGGPEDIKKSLEGLKEAEKVISPHSIKIGSTYIDVSTNYRINLIKDEDAYFRFKTISYAKDKKGSLPRFSFEKEKGRAVIEGLAKNARSLLKLVDNGQSEKTLSDLKKRLEGVENLVDAGPMGDAATAVNNCLMFKLSFDKLLLSYSEAVAKMLEAYVNKAEKLRNA